MTETEQSLAQRLEDRAAEQERAKHEAHGRYRDAVFLEATGDGAGIDPAQLEADMERLGLPLDRFSRDVRDARRLAELKRVVDGEDEQKAIAKNQEITAEVRKAMDEVYELRERAKAAERAARLKGSNGNDLMTKARRARRDARRELAEIEGNLLERGLIDPPDPEAHPQEEKPYRVVRRCQDRAGHRYEPGDVVLTWEPGFFGRCILAEELAAPPEEDHE